MLKRSTILLLAFLSAAAKGWAGELAVIEAYAPKSLTPKATSASVYLTLFNTGVADKLVSVATPAASMAMIHESRIVDGVATMDMKHTLDIPAGGTVTMAPGGLHVMLTGLAAPLKEGEQIDLELVFEKAGAMKVSVPVSGFTKPRASTAQ
jgi:copper(I)-binding protein